MPKRLLLSACLCGLSLLFSSWGFFAHKKINRLAVFTLPPELIRFYKNNLDFVTEHAVDPDKRRYTDSSEAKKHYLDADHYGTSPFDSLPKLWNDAVAKYTHDTVQAYGTLPWQITHTYYQLVAAFKAKDSLKILQFSAALGHYVADAHVPLHTSVNYNGQLTGQTGIHAFWESRLPELFSDSYQFVVGAAHYVPRPLDYSWTIVKNTFSLKDSVLILESQLSRKVQSDKKYAYSWRNNQLLRQYSTSYSRAYHQALNGMVERQMQKAILAVGSFWYSAWIDAGQPNLDHLKKRKPAAKTGTGLDAGDSLTAGKKMLGRDEN